MPKYERPHCRLHRALYGHPEAVALWVATPTSIMKEQDWTAPFRAAELSFCMSRLAP